MIIKRSFTFLIILISLVILGFIFVKPVFKYVSGYLSKSELVSANTLIIEGWLPPDAIKLAFSEINKKKYDYIITTGLRYSSEYCVLTENGYLIFYTRNKDFFNNDVTQHSIEVNAYSELSREHSAHFNLFVNDSLIADFYANKHKGKYSSTWMGSLKEIDSIMIQFTNDKTGNFGDINLFVKEVIIDNKIAIPYQNNSEYDISELDGKRRIINNYSSYAELARSRLISLGIDSSLILAIPGKRVRLNRTLSSAFAFRDWLETSNIEVKGINIITLGTHAKRTWMTYYKILNESHEIGIISLPDNEFRYSKRYRVLKTIRETIGVVYYWLILIPY
jgi:hypothetical protein